MISAPDTAPRQDRYPGLDSFRANEQAIFYGRSRETTELLRLVRAEQLMTLFSKSGLGKSSLLSAGLFPQLAASGLQAVRIRMQPENTAPDPATGQPVVLPAPRSPVAVVTGQYREQVEALYATAHLIPPPIPAFYDPATARLWELVKAWPVPGGLMPVLVFDQFEELFGYPAAGQRDFAAQLGELMHDQPPARVVNWLLDLPDEQQTAEAVAWSQQPPAKTVFAIRTDRLGEMHALKPYIPLILRNRYELGPLTKEAAREAIEKPAEQAPSADHPFVTAEFSYAPEVMTDILAALTEKPRPEATAYSYAPADTDAATAETAPVERDEVEGSQLQIVCQFVESRQKEHFTPVVGRSVVGSKAQIKRVLIKFYRAQLAKVGDAGEQGAAAQVIENELVEGGRRVGLSGLKMLRILNKLLGTDDAHNQQLIKRLQDARLIRSETTQLGTTYELSHDTLIEPVEKSRRIRQAWQQRRTTREEAVRREGELRAERERRDLEFRAQAEDLRLEKEAKARETEAKEKMIRLKDRFEYLNKRLVRVSLGLVILAVGIVFLLIWAVTSRQAAERSRRSALNTSALYQHTFGRQYIAYALWKATDNVQWHAFAPYSGESIQADTTKHYVGTLYDDGTVEVRHQRPGQPDTIVCQTPATGFSLAGSALAIYAANATNDTTCAPYYLQFVDLVTHRKLLPTPLPVKYLHAVTQSVDGRYAVVLDTNRLARLYRLTGQTATELKGFRRMQADKHVKLSRTLFKAIFNQPADHLIVRDDDSRIWLYNLRRDSLRLGPVQVGACRFSGEGNKLAFVNQSRQLLVYDLTNGHADTTKLTFPYHRDGIQQLLFTPDNASVLVLTDEPKQVAIVGLTTKIQSRRAVVAVGRRFALVRQANGQPALHDLVRDVAVACPLPGLTHNLDLIFYAPDGRTDTHLLALYRNRVEVVDLRTCQKTVISQQGQPFGRLTLTGDLLRIQLGERNQDDQATADYLAFFIDTRRNSPNYLRRFVYPPLTPAQRNQYGLIN